MVADLTSDISESQEQETETNSANNNGAVSDRKTARDWL